MSSSVWEVLAFLVGDISVLSEGEASGRPAQSFGEPCQLVDKWMDTCIFAPPAFDTVRNADGTQCKQKFSSRERSNTLAGAEALECVQAMKGEGPNVCYRFCSTMKLLHQSAIELRSEDAEEDAMVYKYMWDGGHRSLCNDSPSRETCERRSRRWPSALRDRSRAAGLPDCRARRARLRRPSAVAGSMSKHRAQETPSEAQKAP